MKCSDCISYMACVGSLLNHGYCNHAEDCPYFLKGVVRCKDCKNFISFENGKGKCLKHICNVREKDYCNYGESKELRSCEMRIGDLKPKDSNLTMNEWLKYCETNNDCDECELRKNVLVYLVLWKFVMYFRL